MTRLALVIVAMALAGTGGCGGSDDPAGKTDAAPVGGSGGSGGSAGAGGSGGSGGSAGTAGMDAGTRDAAMADAAGSNADGAVTGGADGAAASSAQMTITSAGGTVTLGAAKLVVPAGALATGTTITITTSAPAATLPDRSTVSGMVYEFGPTGTTFTKPVEISLPLGGSLPAGKGAVVSWLDTKTNSWVDLPSTRGTDTVTGQTTHFTLFAVRFVANASSCGWGGSCGGSLVGTWDLTSLCIAKETKDVNDICGKEDTASYVAGTGGTATFTVTGDNKYTLTQRLAVRAVYSGACMSRVRFNACSDVETALVQFLKAINPKCTGTANTGCDCTFIFPQEDKGSVTAGNQLVRDMEPAGEAQVAEACAKEGNIQIRATTTKTKSGASPVVTVTIYDGKKK